VRTLAFILTLLPLLSACDQDLATEGHPPEKTGNTQVVSSDDAVSSAEDSGQGATAQDHASSAGEEKTGHASSAGEEETTPPVETSGEEGTTAPAEPYVSGSRVRAVFIVGDDGSKMLHSWWDNQRKETCGWRLVQNGDFRCLPAMAVAGYIFADAACTRLVSSWTLNCQDVPDLLSVTRTETTPCGTTYSETIHTRGAEWTGDIYVSTGALCSLATRVPMTVYHEVGGEATLSMFAQGEEVID
jgi:hypothetical protein